MTACGSAQRLPIIPAAGGAWAPGESAVLGTRARGAAQGVGGHQVSPGSGDPTQGHCPRCGGAAGESGALPAGVVLPQVTCADQGQTPRLRHVPPKNRTFGETESTVLVPLSWGKSQSSCQ